MKYFDKRNVYVQLKDIYFLQEAYIAMPGILYSTVMLNIYNNKPLKINDKNKDEYINFDDIETMAFFKNCSLIADRDEIDNLSQSAISEIILSTKSQIDNLRKRLETLDYEDKVKNSSIIKICDLLNYKIESYKDAYLYKSNNKNKEKSLKKEN